MAMSMFATKCWRSISSHNKSYETILKSQRAFISSSTTDTAKAKLKSRADLFPIYILLGFTGGAVFLAVTSVTQQLVRHPGVQVNKNNRSMVPEVDSPETTLASGDEFITKSILRKVAHIQKRDDVVPTDTPDIYTQRSGDSTNLKTVGVEPRSNRG
ncbi:uncharacterized protein [Rutidosis leptorrhynchoides]|uniref:uncharacterized protein n=1 Tax=Rutidosis leptorrhynchoides TaxID=125765 RepID=UPI003A9A0413